MRSKTVVPQVDLRIDLLRQTWAVDERLLPRERFLGLQSHLDPLRHRTWIRILDPRCKPTHG